jgi:Tol biopolymer transport system component
MDFPPEISLPDKLETFPDWSPDGKYLYFCRADILWPKPATTNDIPKDKYAQVRYDLMRISYDIRTNTWGKTVETVLSSKKIGKSILEPRISPDGRFILLAMCDHGDVPIYQGDSDLYLLDVREGTCRPLCCNSDRTEAWHGWSSNGRWIVFTSKRDDGVYARPYISYVDSKGGARKPFILPQEDPDFYESFLETYNLPELVTGPVVVSEKELARVVNSPAQSPTSMAVTGATPRGAR